MTITDNIENVAKALGWDLEHADRLGQHATVWLPNRHFACQWTIVEFAAYVKAALAERGYRWRYLEHPDRIRVNFPGPLGATSPHNYSPTDPISESHAIILSAEEALSNHE